MSLPCCSPGPDEAWLAAQTVLYVEDDPATRLQFGRFLRRRVGRLIEASSGTEGLERFRAERPVMVIADIEMPGMDGLAMAMAIRALDAEVPIVVTTAFDQISYLHRSIDAGIGKFVAKPVDIDRFEEVLRVCAGRLRASAALAEQHRREQAELRARQREALGRFAGGTAHDFNNLLQVMLGSIDLAALLVSPDAEILSLIGSAQGAAHQAQALGQRLILLAGGVSSGLRCLPIGPALEGALAQATTAWRLDLPASLPPVLHDAELLGLAFRQLVQNAGEAMGAEGLLTITGEVRRLAASEVELLAAGDYLQLSFRDTGPGLDPALLDRIFEPYFTTKPRGVIRGTGLGLSLCLAIVCNHRGFVVASSPPGGGALFTVLLPVPDPR
jgi:signal transduction histidine kinase